MHDPHEELNEILSDCWARGFDIQQTMEVLAAVKKLYVTKAYVMEKMVYFDEVYAEYCKKCEADNAGVDEEVIHVEC
jgi:hypothetical protein